MDQRRKCGEGKTVGQQQADAPQHKERKLQSEDSDEEEQCAISNKWTFERTSRRWSRLEDLDVFSHVSLGSECDPYKGSACPSRESLLTDGSETQDAGSLHSTKGLSGHSHTMPQRQLSVGTLSTDTQLGLPWGSCMAIENGELRPDGCGRTPSPGKAWKEENDSNSECCDVCMAVQSVNGMTATPALLASSPEMDVVPAPRSRSKSLLKSLRGKGITQATSNGGRRRVGGLVISGPICGGPDEETLRRFNCVDLPPSPGLTSPLANSPSSCGGGKRGGVYLGDFDPLQRSAAAAEDNRVLCLPPDHKPGTFPRTLSTESLHAARENDSGWGAWVHLEGHDARSPNREGESNNAATSKPFRLKRTNSMGSAASRISIYDNVPPSLLEDSPPNGFCSQLDAILQQVNGLQALLSQWSEQLSAEDLDEWDSARDSTCHSPASPHPQGELDGTDRSPSGRHDSGTVHGLARPNRRQRLRWHSFQTSHRPSLGSASLHIESQSVAQMNLAQRLCLLKLTALMEKYTPSNRHGWNWAVPKFMKRMRAPDYRDKNVFGVPLLLCVQRTGQPLPQGIQQAMRYLRSQCLDQVGLFRKCGVKSRIQALRDMNESSPEGISYEGQSAYDVADMLKQYFRDLPEPLFGSKLADTFLQIYQYVPKEQQLQALQAAVLLLPDESRESLHTLLCFLSDVAAASAENQMSPKNLAVCLAPSLFHLNTVKRENSNARQRKYSIGKPDQKDLSENLAAIQGLAHMITECKRLFKIPEEVVGQCRVSYLEQDTQPISLADLGHPCDLESQRLPTSTSPIPPSPVPTLGMPDARRPSRSSEGGADEYAQSEATEGDNGAHKACLTGLDYRAHLESCVQGLLKEARDRFRSWVNCSSIELSVDLAYKKVGDGHVLRLWKACTEVDVPPQRLLQRLRNERHLWDPDLLHWQVVETLDDHTELFRYVLDSMAPHPARDYLVLRSWRTDLPRGCCVLVTTSVEHSEVPADTGGEVRGMVLASRFLLEPAGPGRSRLTHICRLDTRGRSSDWYNKTFGHLCAMEIARIRDSFKKTKADLPETKV
uniref:rho GTPase-activating protein 7-like n=1 Tax=Myxine glutinosa TaxID=7769 RepID=UPI00358FC46C